MRTLHGTWRTRKRSKEEGGREDMTKRENAQNYYRQHRKEILAQKRKAYALKKEEKKQHGKRHKNN
jgi:hypothetical protein